MNFVAIDFETATADRNSACALAIVVVTDSEIRKEYSFRFQPPLNRYDPINSRIHGISASDTIGEPTIEEYHSLIYDVLQGANLVTHNAAFDMSVLRHSLDYFKLKIPQPNSVACTYRMTGQSLPSCCEEYGINLDHHDPLSDAKACAYLYMTLISAGISMPEPSKRVQTHIKLCRPAIAEENVLNKDTLFYGKSVVITGTFETFDRSELADAVQSLGASVKTSISTKTDILICGADCGPAKLAKVYDLRNSGQKNIDIINEDLLLKLI